MGGATPPPFFQYIPGQGIGGVLAPRAHRTLPLRRVPPDRPGCYPLPRWPLTGDCLRTPGGGGGGGCLGPILEPILGRGPEACGVAVQCTSTAPSVPLRSSGGTACAPTSTPPPPLTGNPLRQKDRNTPAMGSMGEGDENSAGRGGGGKGVDGKYIDDPGVEMLGVALRAKGVRGEYSGPIGAGPLKNGRGE